MDDRRTVCSWIQWVSKVLIVYFPFFLSLSCSVLTQLYSLLLPRPLCVGCAAGYVMYEKKMHRMPRRIALWAGIAGLWGDTVPFHHRAHLLKKRTTLKESTEETLVTRLSGLISITISWLQILSALTVTYKLAWPATFATYSKGAGALSIWRCFPSWQ